MNPLQRIVQRWTPKHMTDSRRSCTACAKSEPISIPGLMVRRTSVSINGQWCCSTACAERMLGKVLAAAQAESERSSRYRHRIPLGLLLLSRGVITPEGLREALALQREQPARLIGDCLRNVAGLDEARLTAALSAQWACPVFSGRPLPNSTQELQIPLELLLQNEMSPLYWNPRQRVLHVGFLRSVEHRALAAMEQVLECRAEPFLITPSDFREALPENAAGNVVQFSSPLSGPGMAEAVLSYVEATAAQEIRAAAMTGCIWVRLTGEGTRFDLLFGTRDTVAA